MKIVRYLAAALPLLLASSSAIAADPVTLRFTVWDGDEALVVIRNVIKEFEKDNPDIKVKLETFPDYNLYHQKMLVQYAANVAPDVAMMDPGHFQSLAKRNAILPLNQFFNRAPDFDIKKFYKPIVDAHSWKGSVYVLPRDIAPEGLIYYNKKAFDEAGLPYPDGTWTWDYKMRPELKNKDFIWVCDQLTKRDSSGKVNRWAIASGWPELLATTFMYSAGGKQANDNEHPTLVTTNDPVAIKAYQYASDFMNKMKYMPNSTETTGVLMSTAQQLFSSQKIAMFQSGIWEVPKMRREIKLGTSSFFDWDITLFPAFANGKRMAPTGGSGYSIFSSTKYPEQAWKLTSYMAGPKGMVAMAKAGIAQPAIRELALSDAWLPTASSPPERQYPKNMIATDQAVPYVIFGPNADYWPSVSERLATGLDLLWNGQSTAEQVMIPAQKNAQARLETLIKEENLSTFDWRYGGTVILMLAAAILAWIYLPERRLKYTSREKIESRSAYKFISPWIIGMIVFTVGPMLLSLVMSFTDWDIIQAAKWRGPQNYVEAVSIDPVFWKSIKVTFIYTFFSVPMGLCVALGLALLLNQKIRGVPLFRALYYVPSLSSLVAASLIWRKVFNPDNGLINAVIYGSHGSWLGDMISRIAGTPGKNLDWLGNERFALPALIMMSVWGAGGGMVILLAGLQGIPEFYYEAATLDGAGVFQKFKAVTLPLLTPTLFFSLVTGFIGSFQVFTQAFVMTQGGPNDSTRFYMYHLFSQAFQSLRMGYASALAWILFFIILIFTLIQFRMSKWVHYESEAK